MWSEMMWYMWSDSVVKWGEVKWVTLKFLGTKVPCTLEWPYTEGSWLYCDNFIWCVSCTVVVLTCLVIWGVCVGFVMCECFGNICTCIYCVFVLFHLCIFILCTLLFNFVRYEFLLLCLCILIVMHALFCIFRFHHANWHSSVTLTEVFPCFFLSCKARV